MSTEAVFPKTQAHSMTNEEAEKWVKIFNSCLEDWAVENEPERRVGV